MGPPKEYTYVGDTKDGSMPMMHEEIIIICQPIATGAITNTFFTFF